MSRESSNQDLIDKSEQQGGDEAMIRRSSRSKESIIQTVAVKHGIALGANDPLLVMHTMNSLLLDDMASQQADLIAQFKTNLEETAHQWNLHLDVKMSAQFGRIENQFKKLMQEQLEQQLNAMLLIMTDKSDLLSQNQQQRTLNNLRALKSQLTSMRNQLMMNLVSSLMVLFAAIILIFLLIK